MQRRWNLWLALAVLALPAHAAEVTLELAPPEPAWLLPPEPAEPCWNMGLRIEACETQLLSEGMPEVGEAALVFDIAPLLAAGDYEAVLARAALNFGADLALLEAGDIEGFASTRRPTDGRQVQLPPQMFEAQTEFSRARASINNPRADSGEVTGQRDGARPEQLGSVGQGRMQEPLLPDLISATVLFALGHSYFALERYVPAEASFELVLRALPNHARAHESLGMLYLETERYADASVHLERAAQLGRNSAHMHMARGYLEEKMHRYSSAAGAFQQALALEPDNRNAQRGLLHAFAQTRQHAKAKVLVEQLLENAPDDAELWRYRAHAALAAGERTSAIASLETALRLGSLSNADSGTLAALHLQNGNAARAVELLQAAPGLELEFALVDQALGWLADEGEWDGFRALLATVDRAALSGTEQSRLLTRRADLALRDGNRRAAATALEQALELDPANGVALLTLGRIHRTERDYGRAELVLQRASVYDTVREQALVERAAVAIAQDDFDAAGDRLREAVSFNPTSGALRRNVAVLDDLALLRTLP